MKRMKKNKRRGFTVVECVAAILIITIVTACAIGIFRTALSTGEDNWNNYLTDAIAENALAAFQSSESIGEFDQIIREAMVKTAEDRLLPVIEISRGGAAESSLSDVMLPVHFTRVRATEENHTVAFFNGETSILTFAYGNAAKYVDDVRAASSSLEKNGCFAAESSSEASLGTITVKGNGGGSGEGSESTAVEEKIELFIGYSTSSTAKQFTVTYDTKNKQVTYTQKDGKQSKTCALTAFEEELLANGWYLSPTSGTFTNAGMAGAAWGQIYFDAYHLADNTPVKDENGKQLSYWMKLGYNGTHSYEEETWTKATNTEVTYLAYRYGNEAGSTWHDLPCDFAWQYYPTIARMAGGNSGTKNHYFTCTSYTKGGTKTEDFTVIAQSAMEIALTEDTVSISSKTNASDDSSAENSKSVTHAKSSAATPLEKALFGEGCFLYYDANCFRAGGSYLYFYVWNAETKTYAKDEDGNFLCYRVSGARHGSGQWYDGNYFTASKIESAGLTKRAGDYTDFPSSGWTDVTADYEGMTSAEWYFAAYMMDTCSFDSADMTTVDIAVAHDFVCFDAGITVTADGSAQRDLIYTDYLPNGENGVIYYALAKTGEIRLYSAALIAEDGTPIFIYTDTATDASALTGLADGAARFRAEGAFGESGYTLYCSRDRLRIEKVRLYGSSILFLQNVGDDEITVFSFTYDEPDYATDDFAAIKSESGVYRSRYKTIGAIEATLADEYAAGYARLHWDDETGFYSIVIYPSADATEGGVEIFASSDSVPKSDYCDLEEHKDIRQTTTVQDAAEICYYQYVPNGGKYATVIRVQYSHSYGDPSVEPRIMIWKIPSRLLGSKQALGKDIKQIENPAYDKYLVISYRKG